MADERHPATVGLLRWFEYGHLPPHLQAVSAPVGELAREMVELLPDGPELTTGLRKLLEAKDCLVRAAIDADLPVMTRATVRDGSSELPSRCPHRVQYVNAHSISGRAEWLECAMPARHAGRLHRTRDGASFE